MALLAKGRLRHDQLRLEIGAMRIMTLPAALTDWFVGVLPFKLLQSLFMTDKTEGSFLGAGNKKLLKV